MDNDTSIYGLLDASSKAFVTRVLASARDYVGARVSFLSEVVGPDKFIRAAAGEAQATGLHAGMRFDIEDSYCYQLLRGRIPEAIYDARTNPLTCDIPLTEVLGIDSYMGVPVTFADGRAFGTLCCVNFEPCPETCHRDVAFMRFLAGLLSAQLESAMRAGDLHRRRHALLEAVLSAGGPTMVFQPIVALDDGRLVGAEALARTDVPGQRVLPDALFHDAWEVGLGPQMELAAVRGALWALACLPDDAFLSLNVSPNTLVLPEFAAAVSRVPGHRLVLEITEHASTEDYEVLVRALTDLRGTGIRIAIDDVGAGYSSLRHVLRVAPDIVKLDIGLVDAIDADVAKQAMVTGLMAFAAMTGTRVVAEGVETPAQAETLAALGVHCAQGFLYGQPGPLTSLFDPPRPGV